MDGIMGAGVCFICHDGNGRYLFGKRSTTLTREPGTWGPGAGGVEFGESVEEALFREMREEYGTEPLEYQFMNFRSWINDERHHMFMFDYRVLVDPAKIVNNEPDRCDELRWLTLDEFNTMMEPLHPQWPKFLEKNKIYLT